MDYTVYYKKIGAKKQIKNLIKKYKNKKIVLYGAGFMSKTLFQQYDLSKLNIKAVCDLKFEKDKKEENKSDFFNYKTISPNELKEFDCDIILVNLWMAERIMDNIKYDLLINTKNEDKKVDTLFKIPFIFCLKEILR